MIGATSVYVVEVAAIVTGSALAWRSRAHLPVALLLGLGLALDAGGEAIGESPEGWRFALRMAVGSAYPWAVLAVTVLTLRGDGRLGNEGAPRSEAETRTRQSTGFQPARRFVAVSPGTTPGGIVAAVALALTGVASKHATRVGVEPSRESTSGDASGELLQPPTGATSDVPSPSDLLHSARILAPVAALFLCYLAALLSSGVRGPALAWCYAGAQAALAMAMAWLVWGWRRTREPSPAYGLGPMPLLGAGSVPQGRMRRPPTATEIAAIICAATEVAQIPAYVGLPSWWSARAVYAFSYLLLLFVQSRALLGGSPACLPSTSST